MLRRRARTSRGLHHVHSFQQIEAHPLLDLKWSSNKGQIELSSLQFRDGRECCLRRVKVSV
jgi:hypothetical protein